MELIIYYFGFFILHLESGHFRDLLIISHWKK